MVLAKPGRSADTPRAVRALLMGAWLLVTAAGHAANDDNAMLRRAYVDARFGQIHMYTVQPSAPADIKVPLVFFHQTPRSAIEFKPLLLEMGRDRLVMAMDTPGYGGSDRPPAPPDMADLAGAMADALGNLGYGPGGKGAVDLFGFHTGASIATELAVSRPDLVRRVVLSGVGYVSKEGRQMRLDRLPRDEEIAEDGTNVLKRWHWAVIKRPPGMPLERAAEMFLEDIRALNKHWYAYDAVWSYAIDERLPLVEQPLLLLQANEVILPWTRAAKRDLIPHAELIEMLEVKEPVFDSGYPQFAKHLRRWLDDPGER